MNSFLHSVIGAIEVAKMEENKDKPCELTNEEIIELWNSPWGSREIPYEDDFYNRSMEMIKAGVIKHNDEVYTIFNDFERHFLSKGEKKND